MVESDFITSSDTWNNLTTLEKYEQYRKVNGIGPDGEKLIPVIPKDMETKVNLAKGVMTKLMVEYEELVEERTAIYWKVQKTQHGPMQQELLQTLNDVQKKLDAKIIELENLWREI